LFDMTSRTDPPSYGAQLAAGATSLTEAWDANPHSSQNHLMLGHIEQWFYGGLAGIRPDPEIAGLRRIDIHPQVVGDLTSVEASWQTFRGPIVVRWRIEDHHLFRLAISVPPGVAATVHLPAASAELVREGQVPASRAPGVRFLRQAAADMTFEIVSGDYDFAVREFRHF